MCAHESEPGVMVLSVCVDVDCAVTRTPLDKNKIKFKKSNVLFSLFLRKSSCFVNKTVSEIISLIVPWKQQYKKNTVV